MTPELSSALGVASTIVGLIGVATIVLAACVWLVVAVLLSASRR